MWFSKKPIRGVESDDPKLPYHVGRQGWQRVSDLQEQGERAFQRGDLEGMVFAFTSGEALSEVLASNPPEDEDNGEGFFA